MNIVLISDNRYPDGDAGAVRERVLSQMLIASGHTVYRIGRFCDRTAKDIDGVKALSILDNGKTRHGNIINLILFNRRVFAMLARTDKLFHFDVVLLTGLKAALVCRIKRYALKNNIQLVYNSVEMYSEKQFRLGVFSRHYINNRLILEKIIDDAFKVISISSYLDCFFKKRGIQSIRIPFVLEEKDINPRQTENDDIVEIAYVGRPSRHKDFLGEIINGMSALSKTELSRVHLTIAGINRDQLRTWFSVPDKTIEKLGSSISIKGLLSRNEAIEIVKRADFTILFRSSKDINAKAGFPTKVTESLFNGIPVITNITSDLGMFIKEDYNGIIIKDEHDIFNCLKKASMLTQKDISKMKTNAYITARENLRSDLFTNQFNNFINE